MRQINILFYERILNMIYWSAVRCPVWIGMEASIPGPLGQVQFQTEGWIYNIVSRLQLQIGYNIFVHKPLCTKEHCPISNHIGGNSSNDHLKQRIKIQTLLLQIFGYISTIIVDIHIHLSHLKSSLIPYWTGRTYMSIPG